MRSLANTDIPLHFALNPKAVSQKIATVYECLEVSFQVARGETFCFGTFVTCLCMRTTATFYLEGRLVRFSLVGRRSLHPDG